MKRLFLFLNILLSVQLIYAQQGNGGNSHYFPKEGWKTIPQINYPTPDVNALRQEDLILDEQGGQPWRFGFNHPTQINSNTHGIWIDAKNGDQLWMVRIKCPDALTINLAFNQTEIPAGNELYVYNPDKTFILGKFTQEHLYEGQLGTELVPGEEVIVEYYVPANHQKGNVQINNVTHGYRTAREFQEKAFGSSGACNINVNCPQGAPWAQERNGVVMLVSGSNGFCSGSLVNNTLNNGKPYVLTANHCYSNPASWIFRFQWQGAGCNNPAASPSFQSLSGAALRSRNAPSDFCLVEITGGLQGGTVPTAFTPYFNGWDNSGNIPTSAVGIHHPAGDIKKISFENNPLISTSFGGSPANSHWGVTGWDEGVTEGGSSGSPLFDQNHRIIGQLHGGASACGAPVLSDEYGKISYSWTPANSDSTNQLKYWLDPNQSNATFVNGYDPSGGVPIQVDPIASAVGGVSGTFCSAEVTPTVSISNGGAVTLTSLTINYGYDGANNLTYNWSGSLAQWQSTTITLPPASLGGGNHSFSASVSNPNTGVDENNLNNTQSSNFVVVINGQTVVMDLTLDCYGSETSWELQNASGTVLYSGNGYQDNAAGLNSVNWCLDYGCYSYIINDSYGDGLYGLPFCQNSGSLEITYLGDSLTGISTDSSDFGDQAVLPFCVDQISLDELNRVALNVFPNPAQNILFLSAQAHLTRYSILDLSGKTVLTQALENTLQTPVNIAFLSKGMYTVLVTVNNELTLVRKFIKE